MLSAEKRVASGSDFYVYTPSALAQDLFLYPVSVGRFKYLPGYGLQRDSFDSYLIMLLEKGSCEISCGGQTYSATAGQIVLLNCYEPHSYLTSGGWEALWLHFDGAAAKGYYNAISGNTTPVITLADNYRLEKYLKRIYHQFKERLAVKEAWMNNYIINILTELLISRDSVHSEHAAASLAEDTIAYINEHLTDHLSLALLAEQASLSPFYFSRLFKQETGFAPHEYVIMARVNHARYLLKSSKTTIKEICFRTGFSSESSFCNTFKKMTGYTPSQYRSLIAE